MADRIFLQTGAEPLKNEIATTNFLVAQNKKTTIRFLAVSKAKGIRTPDIEMNGMKWEIKNPRKNGKYTLDHAMKSALKQSHNVIFDLRQCIISERNAVNKLKKDFKTVKILKRLIIITKSRRCLHFEK
ncbi:MAG: hypothetical protein LBL08_03025 [Candidatus Nomurabacteria bacterium]|jgi:hypothetical protein|nr:hypothetical protein [Candidatus Nomurabacteria bacterium]